MFSLLSAAGGRKSQQTEQRRSIKYSGIYLTSAHRRMYCIWLIFPTMTTLHHKHNYKKKSAENTFMESPYMYIRVRP